MAQKTPGRLRVATWNIHKGVRGIGPTRRLEIHDIGHGVEQFDADIVCLQEVRHVHRREERHFHRWPTLPQAEFLAPLGYESIYRTNAFTRHGEHGNAVLSRWPVTSHTHEDISDHRFEQRGLLHVNIQVHGRALHVIVVHFGLIPASRVRQVASLRRFIEREVPAGEALVVAGDFNGWSPHFAHALAHAGLQTAHGARAATFPARMPVVQLDHVFGRGLTPVGQTVPKGRIWSRMSDHLPLIADFSMG